MNNDIKITFFLYLFLKKLSLALTGNCSEIQHEKQ